MRENRLYFMATPGRIKIGITVDVKRRLSEIGKHLVERVELLGDVAGNYAFEKHLHSLLKSHALGREWFTDCDEVRDVMSKVLSGELVGFIPKDTSASARVEEERDQPGTGSQVSSRRRRIARAAMEGVLRTRGLVGFG